MSITEVKGRPGWYDVRVYDRVQEPGERPKPIDRRVKGKTAAEKVERDLKNQRDEGSLIGRNASLSSYCESYLRSRRAEVSRQTHHGYTITVHRYIDRHAIGARRIGSIDVTVVSDFYADLLAGAGRDVVLEDGTVVPAAPIATPTVKGVHRVLSMILKRATVDGLLRMNPCTVARPPKETRDDGDEDEAAERGLDPDDARRLIAALSDCEVFYAATIAMGTGLRRSEFLALRWRDVDFKAKELRVNGKLEEVDGVVERTAVKTKRSRRTVPFSAGIAAALKAEKARIAECKLATSKDGLWVDEGWVLPSLAISVSKTGELLPAGRCWTPSAFAQAWRRGMLTANGRLMGEFVAAGGEPEDFMPMSAGVHGLRHTYATMLLRAGVRDEVVSRRLGHSSSIVTRNIYSHATAEEAREGVDVTDAILCHE